MIFLILVLALFLRLINLNQSLWFDEAINVVYARSSDFWWFLTKYPVGDFHPPGWFAILWAWGNIFGFSEIVVRLPSVILGVSTVGLTFLLGKELFNRKTGLLAALLMAIAPLHVYYSQEARMYVLAAFAATLSFYFLYRLTIGKKWSGWGLVISLGLVLYSDYLVYLVIPAQIIYLLWVKKIRKKTLTIFLAAVIILLPWLSIFPTQLKTGIHHASDLPGWANVVGSSFKDLLLIPVKTFFGRAVIFNKTYYLIISISAGVIFSSILIRGIKKMDNSIKLLISWIFIPLILALVISFFIPVLAYFRMIFILPAFYLILGKGLNDLPKRVAAGAVVFICLVSVISLAWYYLNPRFQREDWRGAVGFISQNLDNRTLVIFENNEIPAPVKYYYSDLSKFKPGLSENLINDLAGINKVFLFEYLVDVYDPKKAVEQKLKDLNYSSTKTYDFTGVGFIKLYVKE